MLFDIANCCSKIKSTVFFDGNKKEKHYEWLRIAVTFPSKFLKSQATSCLSWFQDRHTLELDLLTIETTNYFTYFRVTISDEAKFRTQPFSFLSIDSRVGRVVTFGKKVVIFCWQV